MRFCLNLMILCLIICLSHIPILAQQDHSPGHPVQPAPAGVSEKKHDAPMTDIHDIKPLINIGTDSKFLYAALILLFLILLVFGIIYFIRRHKGKKRESVIKTVSPHEAAFMSLDELEGLNAQDIQEYYFRLSIILRNYIQGRYGINAPEMTTEEFLPQIQKLDLKEGMQNTLKEFVLFSDPIKFAGFSTDLSRMKNDMRFARDFVKQTMQRDIESLTRNSDNPE